MICMQTYLVGVASSVSEILPNFSFSTCNCNFIIDARISSFSSSTLLAD